MCVVKLHFNKIPFFQRAYTNLRRFMVIHQIDTVNSMSIFFFLIIFFSCGSFHNMFQTRHTLFRWLQRYQWRKMPKPPWREIISKDNTLHKFYDKYCLKFAHVYFFGGEGGCYIRLSQLIMNISHLQHNVSFKFNFRFLRDYINLKICDHQSWWLDYIHQVIWSDT